MDQDRRLTQGYPEAPGNLVRNYTSSKERVVSLGGGPPLQRERYTRKHYKRRRSGFRRVLTWMLVGILWQLPAYYFLNQQVTQVMFPTGSSTGLTQSQPSTAAFHLTDSRLADPQVSYDDRYVVFQDSSNLEIYDFAQKKIIWQKVPRPDGKILAYQWLPDRESLLLFESGVGANPNLPDQAGVGIYSLDIGASRRASADTTVTTIFSTTGAAASQNEVGERYAASLPSSIQWDTITQVSLSTATNLLYFTTENQGQSHLYEVDVMKDLKVLSWQGEQVAHLAASPDRGAIYYDAMVNNNWQIVAEKAGQRVQVASNPLDKVLGVWNGKLNLGTV